MELKYLPKAMAKRIDRTDELRATDIPIRRKVVNKSAQFIKAQLKNADIDTNHPAYMPLFRRLYAIANFNNLDNRGHNKSFNDNLLKTILQISVDIFNSNK